MKALGSIQAISGNQLTIKTDAGAEVTVSLANGARVLQISPGETDLKKAQLISLSDLQSGDRVLVRGEGDAKSIDATILIAMKKSDLAAREERESSEWQHGVGGHVSAIDVAARTVTISKISRSGATTVVVRLAPRALVRRYSPDSVKFEDAKASTLDQIHIGDQLRARGSFNSDGTDFSAQEIVSGSFRNLAGRITKVDLSAQTITMDDLISKRPVVVTITAQTQLRKLSPEIAARLASRIAGPAGNGGVPAPPPMGERSHAPGPAAASPRDISQILNNQPIVAIGDLRPGDAVMVVSAEDSTPGEATAVALLDGVDSLLRSAGSAQGFTLSPWALGPQGGESSP